MKMNKSISTSDNLIDLYTRIPDYSEVKHLGQSDFINTLEKLKEEFRQCRASLYNEEFCSDSEYLAGKSSPVTNQSRYSSSRPADNLFYYSSKFSNNNDTAAEKKSSFGGGGLGLTFEDGHGKTMKINNHNLTTTAPSTSKDNSAANEDEGTQGCTGRAAGGGEHYLSIKSCELHRTPYRATSASSLTQPGRYAGDYETRSFLLRGPIDDTDGRGEKNNRNYLEEDDDDDYEDDDDDEFQNDNSRRMGRNGRAWSVGSSNSDISISKWSSNPEIYRTRSLSKEYVPPSNVEQRMLQRKCQNNSAPSVAFKDQPEELPKPTFRANPVPDHVYKPLYEFIMLKNQRRSDRIREQSKRRLISQMKPFSFCKDSNNRTSSSNHSTHGKITNRSAIESLNNTKPLKKKRNDILGNIKTNNNRLNYSSATLFKAKPAPPRTKALLAAIRQKEQQDYRELKKRLRAEQLLKNASLPPSMAAREKRTKVTNAKIDEVLHEYQKSFGDDNRKGRRNFRETSTGTDDTGLLTDDDRMTEDDFSGLTATTKKVTTVVKPFRFSQRTPRKFTSFGTSRHSAAATGVFESSSNDNHASRLRYQASKLKEEDRMKREEDELLKIMRSERRRQKLRDSHLHAWQHACSYSAEQDIAMRRQLRHAASILERETFIRDMSCMLSRVRSAPLLLEGGHRLERKKEPCKKHRDEFQKLFHSSTSGGGSGIDRPWNKLSTPRLYSSSGGNNKQKSSNRALSMLDRYGGGGDEKSETLALAEGSLSNSDNESSDDEDEDHEQGGVYDGQTGQSHRNRVKVSGAATDSGASDLEEELEEGCNGHGSIVPVAEGDMAARNSKSNQSNGDGGREKGAMEKEKSGGGGHFPVGTDNEIVDEAELGDSEEDETGNNTV